MNVDKGLIAHWTMDDRDVDSGQLRDRSPYDYHGSISSGVTTGEGGIVNESFNFTNSSGVDVGDPDQSLTGDLTITFWCRANNPSAARETIIDKAYGGEFTMNVESDTSPSQFRIYHGDNGGNSSNYESSRFDGVFPAGEWVHVAWTRDIDAMEERAYVDGSPHSSNPESMSINPTEGSNPITIGSGYTNPLDGNVEDVRIYDRVLSQEEINHIYQTNRPHETRGTLRKGLVGYWSFDDQDMDNGYLRDRSSSGNDGQLVGGVTTGVDSPIGEGYDFDGTDDVVDTGDPYNVDHVTFAVWIYMRPTGTRDIFASAGTYYCEFKDDDATLRITHNDPNNNWVSANGSYNGNSWIHFVGRYDGETTDLFLDGENVGTATGASGAIQDSGNTFTLGSHDSSASYPSDGIMSAARLYNRALSDAEIQRLYHRRTT